MASISPEYFDSDMREQLYRMIETDVLSGQGVFNDIRIEVREAYQLLIQPLVEPKGGYFWRDLPEEYKEKVIRHILDHSKYPNIVRPNPWLPQRLLQQYMKSRKNQIRLTLQSSAPSSRRPSQSPASSIEPKSPKAPASIRLSGWFDPVRDCKIFPIADTREGDM